MKTINIVDYRIKSPVLAKVLVSYTGKMHKDEMKEMLAERLGHAAIPVAASFKKLREGLAVGFIRANRMVRTPSNKELKASYRVMSSNILMDNSDRSLWEVKEGATGRFLARHDQEDLQALVESSVQRRSDLPGLRNISIAAATKSEVVAFVDADGDVDHGFAVATNDEKVRVHSFTRRTPMTVDYDSVISISPITIPREIHLAIAGTLTPAEKNDEKAYYERLYGFDPDYMREVIRQIDAGTEL